MLHFYAVFTSESIVIDDLKYSTIDDSSVTGRVGDGSPTEGNADSINRTKDVIIEPYCYFGSKIYSVVEVGSAAFLRCKLIKFVFIPNTVVVIREYAFYHCYALETIIISGNIELIESYGFFGWDKGNINHFAFCGTTDSALVIEPNSLSGGIKKVFVTSAYTPNNWKTIPLGPEKIDVLCYVSYISKSIAMPCIYSSNFNSYFIASVHMLLSYPVIFITEHS